MFTGGGTAADKAVSIASSVATSITGSSTEDEAVKKLQADPELMLRFQETASQQAVAFYQEETKRLQSVNETMRSEAQSDDPYVRRWRPTFGYVVSVSWLAQMGACGYAIVVTPGDAPQIINSMVNLSTMWGIALAVLGVSVHQRSKDKATAAGIAPSSGGVVGAIVSRLSGNK